ncbi:MAG TPA: RNB domain-containing ribonuclease [Burkholderiales bacterium]|nr:RNB domain-containing ribonuclease [Burkholderiales bacterium]
MNVLYEEDGAFKVGAVLATHPASLHVESPHGRRSKVKAAQVLLRFEHPSAAELLAGAQQYAAELDTDFLWQCSGTAEFGFQDLAREYVGREPAPAEAAGVLLKLHSAPMYFYRRGRGHYQAAPEATLKLALAGQEKKERLRERIATWSDSLVRFECPEEILALKDELLYAPDRAKPETKALEQACAQSGLGAAKLLERCGKVPDSHAYHLGRFLYEFHRAGAAFPSHPAPSAAPELPLASVEAFSLDDIGTTEIDDAFSVTRTGEHDWRVGIHIAAPALVIEPGDALEAIARERLSSAYFPGQKYTMLPPDWISALSLDAGTERPAVSLYLDFSTRDFAIRARHSRIERVRIAANLRYPELQPLNRAFVAGDRVGMAYEEELRLLWQFAEALERARGKPSTNQGAHDYVFRVTDARVRIERRLRGVPLDKLVSELMIVANGIWGEFLAERDIAAIYRVQSSGKVRLSVHPEAHDTLGIASYAWMTSPLRRYVDLLNQRQLAAVLAGKRPPVTRTSESLHAALQAFEAAYTRYDEHQRMLETYWTLRWLLQENVKEIGGTVLRENLVRLEGLPLTTRVSSLPALNPDSAVRVVIDGIDLIECKALCHWVPPEPGRAGAKELQQAQS